MTDNDQSNVPLTAGIQDASLGSARPDEVLPFIEGIVFPVTKNQIIEHAKERSASENVIKTLQDLPNDQYLTLNDLLESIGGIT